jgi:hypothetical protein
VGYRRIVGGPLPFFNRDFLEETFWDGLLGVNEKPEQVTPLGCRIIMPQNGFEKRPYRWGGAVFETEKVK